MKMSFKGLNQNDTEIIIARLNCSMQRKYLPGK